MVKICLSSLCGKTLRSVLLLGHSVGDTRASRGFFSGYSDPSTPFIIPLSHNAKLLAGKLTKLTLKLSPNTTLGRD